MIGFQLIVLTGLLLTGGSVQRHATVDAQKEDPLLRIANLEFAMTGSFAR